MSKKGRELRRDDGQGESQTISAERDRDETNDESDKMLLGKKE